jgi:hypothetical protein
MTMSFHGSRPPYDGRSTVRQTIGLLALIGLLAWLAYLAVKYL